MLLETWHPLECMIPCSVFLNASVNFAVESDDKAGCLCGLLPAADKYQLSEKFERSHSHYHKVLRLY